MQLSNRLRNIAKHWILMLKRGGNIVRLTRDPSNLLHRPRSHTTQLPSNCVSVLVDKEGGPEDGQVAAPMVSCLPTRSTFFLFPNLGGNPRRIERPDCFESSVWAGDATDIWLKMTRKLEVACPFAEFQVFIHKLSTFPELPYAVSQTEFYRPREEAQEQRSLSGIFFQRRERPFKVRRFRLVTRPRESYRLSFSIEPSFVEREGITFSMADSENISLLHCDNQRVINHRASEDRPDA